MATQVDATRRSLNAAKWGSLLMALSGIVAAWLSRSDALLIDGLYSGLGFLSAIVAVKVSESADRPPDRRRPFGYEADQSIFITFRSLVLLGIIVFAGLTAFEKIMAHLNGETIESLVLGPILVYSIAMALVAFGLAAYHKMNMRKTRNSTMLQAEYQGAMMDGGLTVGAGAALLGAPFLNGTALESIVPIADAIVVLVMTLLFLPEPIRIFRDALREIAGEAAPEQELESLRDLVENVFQDVPLTVLETTMSRLGPRHMVVAYVRPDEPVTGALVDAWRDRLAEECESALGPSRVEILIGERPAFDRT
jgi:divalent metal cation (Fe/Co/Zn/Cd) transporter